MEIGILLTQLQQVGMILILHIPQIRVYAQIDSGIVGIHQGLGHPLDAFYLRREEVVIVELVADGGVLVLRTVEDHDIVLLLIPAFRQLVGILLSGVVGVSKKPVGDFALKEPLAEPDLVFLRHRLVVPRILNQFRYLGDGVG